MVGTTFDTCFGRATVIRADARHIWFEVDSKIRYGMMTLEDFKSWTSG